MRNAINNTRMAKRNLIGKNIFRATMLLAIFIFVFAFVCIVADVNLVSQIEDGCCDNVAHAATDTAFSSLNISKTFANGNFSSSGWHNGSFSSSESQTITYKCEGFLHGCGNRTGVIYAKCTIATSSDLYKHLARGASLVIKLSVNNGYNAGDNDKWGCAIETGTPSASNCGSSNWSSGYNPAGKSSFNDSTGTKTCTATVTTSFTTFYVSIYSKADGAWAIGWNSITLSVDSCSYTYGVSFTTNNDSVGQVSPTSSNITGNATSETKASSTASVKSASNGYHFVNWTKGTTSTQATTSATIQVSSSDYFSYTSYKANFTNNTGTIVYNNNNGSGTISNQTITYGTDFTLSDGSGFTRTGYKFIGWSTSNSESALVEFSKSQSITNDKLEGSVSTLDLSTTHGSSITLYAVWAESDYGKLASGTSGAWGSAQNPFVISTPKQLQNLALIVAGEYLPLDSVTGYYYETNISTNTATNDISYAGCYFIITADISMTGAYASTFKPIGSESKLFAGRIYGTTASPSYSGGVWTQQQRTITLNMTCTTNYGGIFGHVKGTSGTRASVGYIKSAGTLNASGKKYVGGVVGRAEYADFSNCANSATVTAADNNGGVFGYILGTTTISGTCTNTGSVTGTSGSGYVGGIGGDVRSTLTNCTFTNSGSVTSSGPYVGGIFGKLDAGSKANSKILSATNTGTVSASGKDNVGGIIGVGDNVTVQGATNSGAITGGQYVGGIFGHIANCTLTGSYTTTGANTITASTSYVGGIAGYLDGTSNSASSITASNTMTISASGKEYAAGIAGFAYNITITSGTNTGNITGGGHTAGIFGQAANTVIMNGTFTNGTNGSAVGTINGTDGMCGGIGGQIHAALKTTSTFANYGSVTGGGDSVGGLFGFFDNIESNVAMRNAGAVTGKSSLGGIVGRAQRGLVATNTYPITNSGTITYTGGTTSGELGGTYSAVGGIAGYINNNIEKATNTGTITVSSGNAASAVGGILGINHNGYNISIISCTNSGAITSGGNYTGGIVGRLSTSATKNVQGCSNSGNISGAGYVGGIAGYLNGYTISTSCSNTGTVTGSGDCVGGFVGEANSLTISLALSNSKAVTGDGYVGGIFGNMNSGCDLGSYAFSNSAQIKGTSYVGGIFGNCPGVTSSSNSLHNLTNSGTIIGSTERVGGLIGSNNAKIEGTMTNTGAVYGYSSAATGTRTAKYVGGFIGYNKGNVSSATIANINTAITVTGAGYVGGLFGATYGSRIAIGTSTTIKINLYGGGDSSHNYGYIGGVFGYVAGTGAETTNTTLDPNTSTNNYFRFTTTSLTVSFSVSGYGSYVGKIAGYATGISIENLSSNDASVSFTNTVSISITNGICVGGIVGYLASCAYHRESLEPFIDSISSYYSYTTPTTVTATGTTVEPGRVYKYSITHSTAEAVSIYGESSMLYFSPSIYGTITTLPSFDGTKLTDFVISEKNDFVSSETPNVFLSTSIYGRYSNSQSISAGTYVGGIIGKVDSGVGNLASGTRGNNGSVYYLGETQLLYLDNSGAVTGSLFYVGGAIGGFANNTTTNNTYYSTYFYGNIGNTGNIGTTGTSSFVGGLIGSVGTTNDITYNKHYVAIGIEGQDENNNTINIATGSYNGDRSSVKTIGGKYYVGGVSGFIGSNSTNYIQNFVNVATITGGSSGYYVGGIAGYMAGGRSVGNGNTISKCLSAPTATVSSSTSFYIGYSFVGGIIGQAGNISIDKAYSLGFAYSQVQADKGGIVGNALSTTTITDSWAVLLVSGLAHDDSYDNTYANFIMVGANTNWSIPSFNEMLVEAGLRDTLNGSYVSGSTNTAPAVGYITLKLAIPGVGGGTNENYIAFFKGNGSREPSLNIYRDWSQSLGEYAGFIDDTASYLYVKTYLAQAESYSVCHEVAQFVNVESTEASAYNGLDADEKIENWINGFNNGKFSDEYISDMTSAPTLSNNVYTVKTNVKYKNLRTVYSDDIWLVGVINKTYQNGTSTLPYTIKNEDQWRTFAGYVRGNNGTYNGAYWKLLKDLNLGSWNSSNNNFFVGDYNTQATSGYAFSGTFDGNGKTVTYSFTNTSSEQNTIGLFPFLNSGAKIMNLYVAGTINATQSREVGGIVGWCNANITIENCRNSMTITAARNVGGIIGYIKGTGTTSITATLKNVVNLGRVECLNNRSNVGGVGGIIGAIQRCDNSNTNTAVIDSASNKGSVYGDRNLGGIVGFINGTCTISNSCNTGIVQSNYWHLNEWTYCGGIGGKVTTIGNINIYASYNSGTVHGYGCRVGGIIGSDADNMSDAAAKSNIYYCFNSGEVKCGHPSHTNEVSNFNKNNKINSESSGAEVGGLVGMAISVNMNYCYNIGNITSYGVLYHCGEYQCRAGGLIGLSYDYDHTNYSNMRYCYNAGIVKIRSTSPNSLYASGLIGAMIYERTGMATISTALQYWSGGNNPAGGQELTGNYSMYGQVDLGTAGVDGPVYNDDDVEYVFNVLGLHPSINLEHKLGFANNYRHVDAVWWAQYWTYEKTIINASAMICGVDANGVGTRPSGMGDWSSGGTNGSTSVLRSGNITGGSVFGYIYIPGCLPQLSIFATDTETSVAMTGYTSGYNVETQTYELKQAGTQYSPYVIQNGVDLLGLSQLVAIGDGYHADNKYYAFANGYNNLDYNALTTLDMNTLNLTGMTQTSYTAYIYSTQDKLYGVDMGFLGQWGYTFPINAPPMIPHGDQSFWQASGGVGKNIRLLRIQNNNYLNGSSSYGRNFCQLGTTASKYFGGSIDGYKTLVNGNEVSYPIINNLKIKRTGDNETGNVYAAFVGYADGSNTTQGCNVSNFTIDNSTITVTGGTNSSFAAPFVAKAEKKVTMSGLVSGSNTTVSVSSVNSKAYAGGICAYADPNSASNGGYSTYINGCISNANVSASQTGTLNYVGGILGYANEVSTRSDVGVFIDNCKTLAGTYSNTSTNTGDIGTGGILGFRTLVGRVDISGCEVGTSTSSVYIQGNHTVGGIISRTASNSSSYITTIKDCTVGANTTIRKQSTTNVNTTHKTAFGGFIGYSENCLITGTNDFSGTIKIGTSGSYVVGENVGGLIGYMGPNTTIQGNVSIDGAIDSGTTSASKNIGGAIGYVPAGANNIDGQFYINPTMTTTKGQYVGGFIGYNAGTLYILGSSSIIDLTGNTSGINESQAASDYAKPAATNSVANTITADLYVGGFIGYNNGTLYIGSQKDSELQDSIGTFTATLVANVNGSRYVGGFVGYNNGTITTDECKANVVNAGNICNAAAYKTSTEIGGIVGYNAAGASFAVEEQENYFANSGTIGYNVSDSTVQYAGGVVGYNAGTFTNIGTLANTGAIYGNQYVAGSIGYFQSGSLYGTMINGVAQTSSDGDTVSRTYSTTTTRFSASTTALVNPTPITLEYNITIDRNYSYNIGKITYYFTAPITGTVKGFENEKVTVLGKQRLYSASGLINNNNNIVVNSTVMESGTVYNYVSNGINYYYTSSVYGMVQSTSDYTITVYPTLQAEEILSTSGYTSLGSSQNPSVNKDKYYYTSGSKNYGFDATDLVGTVANRTSSGAVAFSSLQIEASREPLTGAYTAYEGLRITKGNSYKFYVGTVPYFFEAKVTGLITNIIGNALTISSFTEEARGRVDINSIVKKNHYYVLNNGSEFYFYATVDGKISSINSTIVEQGNTYSAAEVNTTIEASRSAIANPTNIGIGGRISAGTPYTFRIGSTDYYFTAPYTGDITFLGNDGTSVKYGITNTDYTDMLASSRDADSHSGFVSGVTNIGGVVSVVNQATTVGVYKENGNFVPGVYTRLINFGTVQSTSGENVGGSIGQMAGTITGETINSVTQYVEFFNYGTVNVVKNGGGCIGIFSGNGTLVQMFNYQNTNIYDVSGNNLYENIGGCIGIVKKPASGYAILRDAIVVNSGVVRAYTTRTGVTGTGFGGVIGTIDDNAVQTQANWDVDLYSDGSVYCGTQANGQSNAGQFSRVGGLIGAIGTPTGAGAPIVLKSVLNYTKRSGTGAQSTVTAVSGYDYVGGILGLNNSSITAEGVNASVRYCYNVGGEVWGHYSSGTVGGIVGKEGSNSPNTYCCYWVSAFENSALQNAKVNSLGTTLTRSWTTAFSAQDVNNGIYVPETWEEYFAVLKEFLGTNAETNGYFTDGVDDYYLDNYTYELQEEILDENDEVIGYNYSYIDFYDIFFTNNYLTIKEAAQNYYNDLLNGGLDITTIETDTDIPNITTIHDINSGTQSIREKGEEEFEYLQEVVVAYLDPLGTHTFETNDMGDYGFYENASEGTKSYSTGSVKTGYFFAYAHDDLPKYSDREIETEHTRTGASADYDLRMWKYISQAYGNTETNTSISNIIYNYSPSSTDSNGYVDRSGSSASLYHIYARAFMPTINGTPTGYYLFAQAQISSGLVVSYNAVSGSEAFYIDADTSTCQNVLVFYKQVAVTTKLTYNGLQRSAPVAGLTAVESKTPQASYYSFNNHAAVNGVTFNTGTDVGLYYLDTNIYYIPDNAYIFSVPGSGNSGTQINVTSLTKAQETKLIPGNSYYYTIDATSYAFSIPNSISFPNANTTYTSGYGWLNALPTAGGQKVYVVCPVLVGQAVSDTTANPITYTWKISERKLTSIAVNKNKTTGSTAIYYDKESHSVTVTISNVVSADTTPGTYTTENALKALNMYFKLTFTPSASAVEWSCKVEAPASGSNITSSNGFSTKDGGYCSSTISYQIINYVYTISAVNAGTYSIRTEKDNAASKANNYSVSMTTATLVINKKALTATWIGNETVEFDNMNHTLTLQVSGWAAGETVGTIATSNTVLNWVNGATYSASGLTKGTPTCSNQSASKTTATSVVSLPFTAKNKGSYKIQWSALSFGSNYTLPAGQTDTLTITAMVLEVSVQSSWGTGVYNGDDYEYKLRITSHNDTPVQLSFINEIIGKITVNVSYYDQGTGATNTKTKNSDNRVNITVTFKAKHAGGYKFGLGSISENDGNYGMTAFTTGARQNITQKALTITGKNTNGESYSFGTYNYVYNQAKQGLGTVTITGFVNSSDASAVLGSGMNNSYTNVNPSSNSSGTTNTYTFGVANVGNYYAGIGLKTSNTTASNYSLAAGTWTWNINSIGIRCTWSETTDYVFTGESRTRPLASIALYNGDDVISGFESIYPSSSSINSQTFNINITGTYKDTITLTLVTPESINVGNNYSCSVSSFTLTGINAAGDSIASNYVLTSANTTFNIIKSKVYVNTSSATTISKVYDHTTSMPEINLTNALSLTFASSNGGASNPGFTVYSASYDNANVGTGKNITYVLNLSNASNYEWRTYATDRQIVIDNGEITQKQLLISLYKKGSNITKVYDNNEYFGGATGAVYSEGSVVRSATYRSGNGFEVRNIVASESAGAISVTAVFQEVDRNRSAFDKYINNVENNNGAYSVITPSQTIPAHYKQIVFTLSGSSASNYSLALVDGSTTIATSSTNTITYADSADALIHVMITRYTVNVTYGYTYQSYAQTKNEYTYENVGWLPVTAMLPTNSNVSNSLDVTVDNTWMYDNHIDMTNGWAKIVTYTRITGGQGKNLFAVLGGPNGIALNYNIKAQPVLVIDYFVSEGDNYEITTLAGLMLATYYYKNYATLGVDDKVYSYEWIDVCNDAGYEAYMLENPTAELEYDPATNRWGYWEATEIIPDKYDKFLLNADISGIMTARDYDVLKNAFGVFNNYPLWGYGMGHTVDEVYVTYLDNFMQTNIGEEVVVIGNFFADEFDGTFDGNGYVIKDFTQIYNVSVATRSEINIGFFGKATNTASIVDMALREYKLYVYDYTELGNTLNIGALVGLSLMSTSMTDTTVHASISVEVTGYNAVVSSGLVMGKYNGTITASDESGSNEYEVVMAIENVIGLGNLEVNNASGSALVGGVLGSIGKNNSNGSGLFGAIAFADVNVTATTPLVGGLIGYVWDTSSISTTLLAANPNCFTYLNSGAAAIYLANSTVYRTSSSAEWTVSSLAIGNVINSTKSSTRPLEGTSYTDIMTNSNTGYSPKYRPDSTTTKGSFDIISEVTAAGNEAKFKAFVPASGGIASAEPRESVRIYDLIKIYILKFEKSETTLSATIESTAVTLHVYQLATSNTMLGSAIGTTSSKITLSYAQHIAMLRMFRFAEFELKKQINLPVNNYNIVYSGVFYGHITTSTVQVISTSNYTARNIGSKTYATLAEYVAAYQTYYNVTLTISAGYYVYTSSIYVFIKGSVAEQMFEKEINMVPINGIVKE